MQGFIATTDFDWYTCLSERSDLDEVNFWQPSGGSAFRALTPGEPLFFKLKRPHDAVAGFGLFARHSVLPAWLAWESFGPANGAPDFPTMRRRIEKYRRGKIDPAAQYQIGCIMLSAPVFFPRELWVEQPGNWKKNIVRGAGYDLLEGEGRRIWEECRLRAAKVLPMGVTEQAAMVAESGGRYGAEQIIWPRLGQGTFRISVMEAYDRACAVTTEHSLPVLEAAHIRPYAECGEHDVTNGVLLRSDVHKLFDRGYVTVTPDFHIEVSGRLKEDFDNGKSYYQHQGGLIHLPTASDQRPSAAALTWHNEHCYLG